MHTQGVEHVANHPGPLGVFFRRPANVAISSVAVTIAFLMLKNKEQYRCAVAKRVHEKFTHKRRHKALQFLALLHSVLR